MIFYASREIKNLHFLLNFLQSCQLGSVFKRKWRQFKPQKMRKLRDTEFGQILQFFSVSRAKCNILTAFADQMSQLQSVAVVKLSIEQGTVAEKLAESSMWIPTKMW